MSPIIHYVTSLGKKELVVVFFVVLVRIIYPAYLIFPLDFIGRLCSGLWHILDIFTF